MIIIYIYIHMIIMVTTNYTFSSSKIFRPLPSSVDSVTLLQMYIIFTTTYKFIMTFIKLFIFTREL